MSEKQISAERELLNKKNDLLTDKEAAKYLRISQITLWRERKAGRIAFRRASSKLIYKREDLENYLERNKREAFACTA